MDSSGTRNCIIGHPKPLQTCQQIYSTVNEDGWFSVSMNKSTTSENDFCEILQEESHLTHFKDILGQYHFRFLPTGHTHIAGYIFQ